MRKHYLAFCILGTVGCVLLGVSGCANKDLQSSADVSQSAGARGDAGQNGGDQESFPAMGGSGNNANQDTLRGFDQVQSGQGLRDDRVDESTLGAKQSNADTFEEYRKAGAHGELVDVFFDYDSWRIPEEGRKALNKDAEWLRNNQTKRLTVEGHCDERGSSAYNLVLGEKRAKSIRKYLGDLGVAPERMTVVSYGEERPFCRDQNEGCYRYNRRGHMTVR